MGFEPKTDQIMKCLSPVNLKCFFMYKHLETEQILPCYFNHKARDDSIDLKGPGEYKTQRKGSLFTPQIKFVSQIYLTSAH